MHKLLAIVDDGTSAERLVARGAVWSEEEMHTAIAAARVNDERRAAAFYPYDLKVLKALAEIDLAAEELLESRMFDEGQVASEAGHTMHATVPCHPGAHLLALPRQVAEHEADLIELARLSYPFLQDLAQLQFRKGFRKGFLEGAPAGAPDLAAHELAAWQQQEEEDCEVRPSDLRPPPIHLIQHMAPHAPCLLQAMPLHSRKERDAIWADALAVDGEGGDAFAIAVPHCTCQMTSLRHEDFGRGSDRRAEVINRAVGWINRYLRDDELPAVRELGSKLKVVELKQLLREQGLRQSGKKSELVRRLVDEGLSAERLVASGRVMSENAATAATAVARAATEREAAALRRYKLTVLRSLAQIESSRRGS